MALTGIERKAAFVHAAALRETTKTAAAQELGYSWTHVLEVLAGARTGSREMKQAVADYCGAAYDDFWGEQSLAAAS